MFSNYVCTYLLNKWKNTSDSTRYLLKLYYCLSAHHLSESDSFLFLSCISSVPYKQNVLGKCHSRLYFEYYYEQKVSTYALVYKKQIPEFKTFLCKIKFPSDFILYFLNKVIAVVVGENLILFRKCRG
jgi:hypothetical protein